jgi:hypothetical protein
MSGEPHVHGRGQAMPRGKAQEARKRWHRALRDERKRAEDAAAGVRDMAPAVGTPAEPAPWRRAVTGVGVALHGAWREARWSYLFRDDTDYATPEAPPIEQVRDAARSARTGDPPPVVQGPVMKPPVWTWEIPLYFWFGGMAAGASFVAFACDLAGDEQSGKIARKVALAALIPSPPLLISDLGRPERFYKMLRVFKPRSPMSMGVWALTAFANLAAASVAADELGRRRTASALGAANALVGGYFGSYTGVLLATTAVPIWARSRLFLGPIFVATATVTGAAAVRLVLAATGLPRDHPTRDALARIEAGAMAGELALSYINEKRLDRLALSIEQGVPGRLFQAAKGLAAAGIATRLARRRAPEWVQHAASVGYLASALAFRVAWVWGGRDSARDDEAVARMARARATIAERDASVVVVEQH